jgi:tetratricopeptide (TPR) repeat protein
MNGPIISNQRTRGIFVFILALLFLLESAPVAKNLDDEVKSYLNQKEWEKAIVLLKNRIENKSADGQTWTWLGYAYYNQGEYKKAISSYQMADSLDFSIPQIRYNIACCYALLGDKENSLKHLNSAVNAGFRQIQLLYNDQDLQRLRNDPRFQELVLALEQEVNPCLHNPVYREFDFWIGEWDVFNQQGQKVGENSIQKSLKECVILENWTSVRGSKGQSINFYDPSSGTWKQTWVDEGGRIIRYSGKIVEGSMHFYGEFIDKDGNQELAKVVLEPLEDGRVHHLIQHSKDYGKTWYNWFDGIYVRKEQSEK